jgi:quercetin dioxygenase-like cupin family protein
MPYPTLIDEIQGHNVTKLDPQQGPSFAIGDTMRVTWKAEGKDTGYVFACYEISLAPGGGIPLHKHPYAEFFYVVEGRADFQRWSDAGDPEWISCEAGSTVLAPPNAPHAFLNRSQEPTKFIATSTYHHELMVKQSETPTGVLNDGYPDPSPEGFKRLTESERKDQVYYL